MRCDDTNLHLLKRCHCCLEHSGGRDGGDAGKGSISNLPSEAFFATYTSTFYTPTFFNTSKVLKKTFFDSGTDYGNNVIYGDVSLFKKRLNILKSNLSYPLLKTSL